MMMRPLGARAGGPRTPPAAAAAGDSIVGSLPGCVAAEDAVVPWLGSEVVLHVADLWIKYSALGHRGVRAQVSGLAITSVVLDAGVP